MRTNLIIFLVVIALAGLGLYWVSSGSSHNYEDMGKSLYISK